MFASYITSGKLIPPSKYPKFWANGNCTDPPSDNFLCLDPNYPVTAKFK